MQLFVSMIFSREIQRPSSAKLWHIPLPSALPISPFLCDREVPLDAQDTSYLADSANIFNLSKTDSSIVSQRKNFLVRKQIENS